LNGTKRFLPKRRHDYGKKIAVVGAGPSGLSCAYFLAIDGYKVTVFEKQKSPGGMLSFGIPAFRLEKDVINAEIDVLRELGIEFKTGVEVGRDISLADLRAQGYEAFYLAIGAQGGRKLKIEGEDAEGVISGVDFLREINLGSPITLKGKTVVVGGGNVAIDVARSAVRVGAETALYCLESREEMPALEEEIEEAAGENITINNSWGPKRILTRDGPDQRPAVCGVEFKRCVSVFDENKKFNPRYDEDETITVEADYVLLSIGQSIEWGGIAAGSRLEFNPNNTIKADSFTLQTAEPDVFAGGDAFTGPKFAIDAIALGKEAAISIHRFVQPGQSLVIGRDRREYRALDKRNTVIEGYDNTPRQKPAKEAAPGGASFRDTRGTFTEEQLKKETERCLGCGATVTDEFLCVGCGQCTTKCKFDAISLVRKYDGEGVAFEGLKPVVIKQILKRTGKIAIKELARAVSGKKDR
jgi:NADPH-dependent glutamate synthase beta subunit-like oxidoreductase